MHSLVLIRHAKSSWRHEEASDLLRPLNGRGYRAEALHGGMNQEQRDRVMARLRSGTAELLVATDVAARGLDVDRISHVVNFDIPTDTESYVHRIGRTGRAGRTGDAISFITPRERYLLRHIERATRQEPTQMQLPSTEDVNTTRLARFDDVHPDQFGEPLVHRVGCNCHRLDFINVSHKRDIRSG